MDGASGGDGAEAFAARYGRIAPLFRLAELKPVLVALFGDKGTVDKYSTFEALEALSFQDARSRREAHIHQRLTKAYEQEARGRRRK